MSASLVLAPTEALLPHSLSRVGSVLDSCTCSCFPGFALHPNQVKRSGSGDELVMGFWEKETLLWSNDLAAHPLHCETSS